MNNIERYTKIKKEMLSREFYFQSLLQEAWNQAELSDSEMEGIQIQCLKLLADSIERYNQGESSSVQVEAAQTIMASNLYTIGIYLKSLPDASSALDKVKEEPILKLFQQGRKIIDKKLKVAQYLYHLVCKTRIESANYSYNATIQEGIKSFFRQYQADYEAQETPASIDYQLMKPITDLAGVEYMVQYLQNLYLENLFCSKFESFIIHQVMCGYHEDYKDLLINICGQVLQNALGCEILNKDISSLNLSLNDIRELKSIFSSKSKETIGSLLQQKANAVLETLALSNPSLKTYIYTYLPEIASRIYTATNNDTLPKIFVSRRRPGANQVTKYSMGTKMNDKDYRDIVNEVLRCRYWDDKIQIIKKHIKTLSDMEDIIMDGRLNQAEASAVFKMLDDVEIAVLVKRHPYHREIDTADFSEAELSLQQYLEKYLQSIPKDRLKQIHIIMANIEDI